MGADGKSETVSFLYKIIDDTQSTIRYIDTKAGAGIAILGVVIGKMLDRQEVIASGAAGWFVITISSLLVLAICLSAILAYKTVFPMVNPAENVSFPDNLAPQFFIAKFGRSGFLRYFSSSKDFVTLGTTHAQYCAALQQATDETLESVVAAEVLKLSFIRQLKIDRLGAFAKALTATVTLFVVVMFAGQKEPKPNSADMHIKAVPTATHKTP